MNFGKRIWNDIKNDCIDFSAIRTGEGVVKKIDDVSNFYFHLNGSYSHLELIFGIKNTEVTSYMMRAMKTIKVLDGHRIAAGSLLVGLFYKKIGDFCAESEHIGVFCPPESMAMEADQLINLLRDICNKNIALCDINILLEYVIDNKLLNISNKYEILAASMCIKNIDLFYYILDFYTSNEKYRCGIEFRSYAESLLSMKDEKILR